MPETHLLVMDDHEKSNWSPALWLLLGKARHGAGGRIGWLPACPLLRRDASKRTQCLRVLTLLTAKRHASAQISRPWYISGGMRRLC